MTPGPRARLPPTLTVMLASMLVVLSPVGAGAQQLFVRPGSSVTITPFVGYQAGFDLDADFTATGGDGAVEGASLEQVGPGLLVGAAARLPLMAGLSVTGAVATGRSSEARTVIRTDQTTTFGDREGVGLRFARLGLAYALPGEVPVELVAGPAYLRADPPEEEDIAPELSEPYSAWAIHAGAALSFPVSPQVSWTLGLENYYLLWDQREQEERAERIHELELDRAVTIDQETKPGHMPAVHLGLAIRL